MKFSTKSRYALRLMAELARYAPGTTVPLKEISERQNLSLKYLEQIVSVLVRANYLRSIRGPQGGYRLTKRPEEYVVGDILRLTEGSLSPVECLSTDRNDCPRADSCVTLRIWKELDEAIRSVVDKYTLEDLLNWSEQTVNNFVI